jgi:hypothetical protein
VIALIALLALTTPASAAPPPATPAKPTAAASLTGVWSLDRDASDDLTPLLEVLQVPGWQRAIAARMSATHTLEDLGDRIKIRIDTAIRSDERVAVLDGVARLESSDKGPAMISHLRTPDGVIVSDVRPTEADGLATTLRRYLDPRGRMVFEIGYAAHGVPKTIRRVFVRQ